jgi:hypothetical protein
VEWKGSIREVGAEMNLGYGWERAKEECKESTAKTEWQCLHSALGAYLCDGLRKHHERSL